MASPRGTLFGIIAVTAMLVSAGGIAYMSSVSYPDELGIVDARAQEHHERARELADSVLEVVEGIVSQATALSTQEMEPLRSEYRYFVIGADGELLYPYSEPLRQQTNTSEPGPLPERGFQSRQRALERARSLELGACETAEDCLASPAQRKLAMSIYEELQEFADAGAEALLGLARLHRADNEMQLAGHRYRDLRERFGERINEADIPYGLLADVGIAEVEATAAASLLLLRALIDRQYDAPGALLAVAAQRALSAMDEFDRSQNQNQELEELSRALTAVLAETVFARRLQGTLKELVWIAGPESRSMGSPWDHQQNLVVRRLADGRVLGVMLHTDLLRSFALQAAERAALHSALHVIVESTGGELGSDDDIRARIGLGPILPQLSLALAGNGKATDAMADIAEARRRHRAITGGLVAILVVALFATIRGAARERELARLKSDLVSTVSHELKTPLTSIRMFAEMLQHNVAGDDRAREVRYQGIIVKEAERLGLLISNMLNYSQIERGTRQYSNTLERPSSLANEACETFKRFREGGGPQLVFNLAPEAQECKVKVERAVIVQCLLNLLSNAAKYGGDNSIELSVRLNEDKTVVELSVRDEGPGIPQSEQTKVFREFYRAPEAASSAIEGTGLGLALVKRHIEAQGGQVELSSMPDKGATFTLKLPVDKS